MEATAAVGAVESEAPPVQKRRSWPLSLKSPNDTFVPIDILPSGSFDLERTKTGKDGQGEIGNEALLVYLGCEEKKIVNLFYGQAHGFLAFESRNLISADNIHF